jgi:hypothetical protein
MVPVCTGLDFVYWYVLVHTGTYQYILVRTILPDPVQVYRIPDDVDHDYPPAGRGRRRVTS